MLLQSDKRLARFLERIARAVRASNRRGHPRDARRVAGGRALAPEQARPVTEVNTMKKNKVKVFRVVDGSGAGAHAGDVIPLPSSGAGSDAEVDGAAERLERVDELRVGVAVLLLTAVKAGAERSRRDRGAVGPDGARDARARARDDLGGRRHHRDLRVARGGAPRHRRSGRGPHRRVPRAAYLAGRRGPIGRGDHHDAARVRRHDDSHAGHPGRPDHSGALQALRGLGSLEFLGRTVLVPMLPRGVRSDFALEVIAARRAESALDALGATRAERQQIDALLESIANDGLQPGRPPARGD